MDEQDPRPHTPWTDEELTEYARAEFRQPEGEERHDAQ